MIGIRWAFPLILPEFTLVRFPFFPLHPTYLPRCTSSPLPRRPRPTRLRRLARHLPPSVRRLPPAHRAFSSPASRLDFSLAYQYIIAGIVGAFVVRNAILTTSRVLGRRRNASQSAAGSDTEKGDLPSPPASLRIQGSSLPVRVVGALDRFGSAPVWFHRLGPEWSLVRSLIFLIGVTINIAFCLVSSLPACSR